MTPYAFVAVRVESIGKQKLPPVPWRKFSKGIQSKRTQTIPNRSKKRFESRSLLIDRKSIRSILNPNYFDFVLNRIHSY